MSYSLLSHTSVAGLNSPQTTGAIDTTGATLLVVAVSSLGGTTTVTDSKGNTWTKLTIQATGGDSTQLFYSVPTSVGAGHTFTSTGIFAGAVMVQAWGNAAAVPFDLQNGAVDGTSNTSLQTGSITPSENNCLVVACLGLGTTSTNYAIDSGFTISDSQVYAGGSNIGGSMAYLIQGTAGAVNPTWSWTSGSISMAAIASFKAAAGGSTAGPLYMHRTQQRMN